MLYARLTKEYFLIVCGIVGGTISALFGGWNYLLTTLLVAMGVDFVTGLVVAGVFKKSQKTPNGALESNIGWKGIAKKGVTLLIVLIAHRLDLAIGTTIIRDAVVIAFIINEVISITKNAGLMGVPVPPHIKKAIEVLKEKE